MNIRASLSAPEFSGEGLLWLTKGHPAEPQSRLRPDAPQATLQGTLRSTALQGALRHVLTVSRRRLRGTSPSGPILVFEGFRPIPLSGKAEFRPVQRV